MEMLLMGACLSMFGLAVACVAFGAATRDERAKARRPEAAMEAAKSAAVAIPARFFVERPAIPEPAQPRVPIEALLLQIENHVRLEQAAAESFLQSPTPALLHGRTVSPLVN
jgi:hypothetical protein